MAMKKLLPQNVGLGLFDSDGQILGVPQEQQIGEACLNDLDSHFNNTPISSPAIHTEIKQLAHFDIIEKVVINDEVAGVIFASFSLKIIQNKLDNIIEKGQNLSIVTSDGHIIAQTKQFDSENSLSSKKIAIPNTDWSLLIEIEQESIDNIFYILLSGYITLFIILSLCNYWFLQKINQVLKSDFNIVTGLLNSLKIKHELPKGNNKTNLEETEILFSSVVNIAEEIADYEQQLLHLTNTDELTKLPNLRYFNEFAKQSIAQAKRNNEKLAIIYMDLDGFKTINDEISHFAGDAVLTTMADRFRDFLRQNELISRIGGDEFCMIVYGYKEETELNELTTRLLADCEKMITVGGMEIKIGLSIGMARYPEDGKTYDELMSFSDNMMYKKKHERKK